MKKHKNLLITTSRTDEPVCIACGASLHERTLCYSINKVQATMVPLCADCLRRGARMLDIADTLDALETKRIVYPIKLEIQYSEDEDDNFVMEEKEFNSKDEVYEYIKKIEEFAVLEKLEIAYATILVQSKK